MTIQDKTDPMKERLLDRQEPSNKTDGSSQKTIPYSLGTSSIGHYTLRILLRGKEGLNASPVWRTHFTISSICTYKLNSDEKIQQK